MKETDFQQIQSLKSKPFYTQEDYEKAYDLLNQNRDPEFQDELRAIIHNISEVIEHKSEDRK